MNHPFVQLLLLLVAVWMLLVLGQRLVGLWFVVVVTVLAGIISINLYLLRYHPQLIARGYKKPGIKTVIDCVCRLTSNQVPVESSDRAELPVEIMLREPPDFDWAIGKLRGRVIAHDEAIESCLRCLRNRVALRSASTGGLSAPLATLLLVGPTGIGKRHLSRSISELLFKDGHFTAFDFAVDSIQRDGYTVLFGDSGTEGQLNQTVRRYPYQVVMLENVDRASSAVKDTIHGILRSGQTIDHRNRSVIRYEHVVFVFSVADELGGLGPEGRESSEQTRWNERVHEVLSTELGFDPKLLSFINQTCVMSLPDRIDCARIIAMLMKNQAARYALKLEYVAPEIIADEVSQLKPTHGFELAHSRISMKLEDAILDAKQSGEERLVITTDNWPALGFNATPFIRS